MNEKVVLSHRRINYPCMEYEFYNPLEYIFDIQVRDISEYLKSMFFYTDRNHTIKELKNMLNDLKNYFVKTIAKAISDSLISKQDSDVFLSSVNSGVKKSLNSEGM